MTNYKKRLIIGTRGSKLAIAQTTGFIEKLIKVYPDISGNNIETKIIKTSGDQNQSIRLDQMGGKGLFAKEIEKEILNQSIDIGIHSMKDLPATEDKEELSIGCWLERFDPRDALLSNQNITFHELSKPAVVGTSSIRRRSQVLNLRKDISIQVLRGNVDTRIQKLNEGKYDAIILSLAGLQRLKLDHLITHCLSTDDFLPASCQGAVGVQYNTSNQELESFLAPLNHKTTGRVCLAEREVLKYIKANCNSPIGLLAEEKDNKIIMNCEIFDHSSNKIFSDSMTKNLNESIQLGQNMGEKVLNSLGQKLINELDNLKDDFDYTSKN